MGELSKAEFFVKASQSQSLGEILTNNRKWEDCHWDKFIATG